MPEYRRYNFKNLSYVSFSQLIKLLKECSLAPSFISLDEILEDEKLKEILEGEYLSGETRIWEKIEAQLDTHFKKGTKQRKIAEEIINNLDKNGILEISLNKVSRKCNADVNEVEKVRVYIRDNFYPKGLACLSLEEYREITGQGFPNFLSQMDIKTSYILPDIIIKFDRNQQELVYEIPGKNLWTKIQIEKGYGKHFKKFNRAIRTLKKSLIKRAENFEKIADYLIKYQENFFTGKISLPIIKKQKEVAKILNMSPSTICRLIKNKYVETPRGIFPLEFFFSKSPKRLEIKKHIAEILRNQEKISDQKIKELLEKNYKIKVSRRLINKIKNEILENFKK